MEQRRTHGPGRASGSSALALFACLLACLPAIPAFAQRSNSTRPSAPAQPRGGGMGRVGTPPPRAASGAPAREATGQHLPQWFAQHQNLSPNEQENALRHEPGFGRLPGEQQQQLVDRLHRLDMQPPAQRQRIMERNERFEALPPERQQEIRGASQALGQMPQDRRQAVRQAFRDLRNLPPADRQNALNSARFQAEYSPQERSILGNLLSFEP